MITDSHERLLNWQGRNALLASLLTGVAGSAILLILAAGSAREWIPAALAAMGCLLTLTTYVAWGRTPLVDHFSVMIAFLLSAVALASGSVESIAYPGFLALIVLAGLMLGWRVGAWVAALALAFTFYHAASEQFGWLGTRLVITSPLRRWAFLAGYVTDLGILQFRAAGFLREVHERAEKERERRVMLVEKLAGSEEKLRVALASTTDMLYDWNPLTDPGLVSPRLYRLLGYPPDEVPAGSREWLNYVHPDDRAPLSDEHMEIIAGNRSSFDRQYRLRGEDGEYRCFRDRGRVIGRNAAGKATRITGSLTDVSQQRRAEEALLASEMRYREVVEYASDFIFTCDEEGRFDTVNATMVRVLGYSKEQLLGLRIQDLFLPDFSGELQRQLRSCWGKALSEPVYAELANLNGDRFRVSLKMRPIANRKGQTIGLQGIGRDMTRQHELEEQLRQSQKMEALGHLAGGVAHDFNNLLTVINGFSDLAMNRLDIDDELIHDLEQIRQAGDRAAGLTRQLLAFSRKQVVQPRVVDVNQVVTGLEKMLSRVVREDVHIEISLASEPLAVMIDVGHLEQVMMNLVANARDAMPQGGRLLIRTANVMVQPQGPLFKRGIAAGAHVCLEIDDTGIGMDQAVLARVFDPFFTTKPAGIGTGLGLSTVYGIVQQAQGRILVDSEPGEGATFRVYLPASAETPPDAPRHGKVRRPARGSGVILLVEDSRSLRDLLLLTLQDCGYTVLAAASPDEALEIAANPDIQIDLVITDVVMSGMSGIELGRRLQVSRPELRLLYMSGYSNEIGDATFDPNRNFLQKPFSQEKLSLRVRQLLAPTEHPRSILVMDEDDSIRAYLRRILQDEGYEVLEARHREQACEYLRAHPVDVLIAGLRMSGAEGEDLIRSFRQLRGELKVVVIPGAYDGHSRMIMGADVTLAKPLTTRDVFEAICQLTGTGTALAAGGS